MALNPKQLTFAQNVAAGVGYQQSAINAGYSPITAHNQANKLLKIAHVKAKIAEIQAQTAKKVDWSREMAVKALLDIHNNAPKNSDKVAALKEVNVMLGYHEPQKVEHSGSLTQIQRIIKK